MVFQHFPSNQIPHGTFSESVAIMNLKLVLFYYKSRQPSLKNLSNPAKNHSLFLFKNYLEIMASFVSLSLWGRLTFLLIKLMMMTWGRISCLISKGHWNTGCTALQIHFYQKSKCLRFFSVLSSSCLLFNVGCQIGTIILGQF